MAQLRQTEIFAEWLRGLDDQRGKGKIQARPTRLELGNPGDVEPVGEGVSELRINFGPGYRVYVKQTAKDEFTLLTGGTKDTQSKDVKSAKAIARNLEE